MNEYNYPVKFAVMPIYENNKLVFNIVSRVYLISEKTIYDKSGDIKVEIEVFFPFVKNIETNTYQRIEPTFKYDVMINAQIVDEIFETYEEANNSVFEKNKAILLSKMPKNNSENYEKKSNEVMAEFHNNFEKYKNVEALIESNVENTMIKKTYTRTKN